MRIISGFKVEVGVAVTKEAEAVLQGIVINFLPIVPEEGGHQEQQGAVRLVEVGKHTADHSEPVSGNDDDGSGEGNLVGMVGSHPIQQIGYS